MIEAAALISFLRRDWPDFAVVAGLLLYNAAVGFWQDNKAANALAALKKGLALKARTLRGNQWLSIDAADLVPGDVVTIAAGEIVPADVLLIDGRLSQRRPGSAHRRIPAGQPSASATAPIPAASPSRAR